MNDQLATITPELANTLPVATGGYQGAFSNSANFEAAQRMAMALVNSSMMPKQYQGKENLGNAIIALEMAQRIGANPLMICQNLYLVHGNPGWSAKFMIASFNQCGRFSAIRYEWKDCNEIAPEYGCRAFAMEKATGETIYGPWITWLLVKAEGWDNKNGSKWKSMPEKMFMYRAAAWMIDSYAPEISMGLQTEDQLHDVYDVDPTTGEITNIGNQSETGSRTSSVAEKVAAKAAEKEIESEEDEPTFDATQLLKIVNDADSLEGLDEVEDMARSLDARTKEAKELTTAIEKRRADLQA